MIESLQKCSDREAKIYFSQSWQDIRKIKDLESDNFKSSKALNLNRTLLKNTASYNRFDLKDDTNIKSASKEKQFQHGTVMAQSRVKAYNNLPNRYTNQQSRKPSVSYNIYANESNQRRENALKSQVEMLNLQIEKYKQKCRNYDRKEREMNATIKDLRDNV